MPELHRVICSDGVINLVIPPYPTVIKENLYPPALDEEVYMPEYGRPRKLLYRVFHPNSFRRVPITKEWAKGEIEPAYGLLIACPYDKWDDVKQKCKVGTVALQIWHPYERLDELLWRCRLAPDKRESLAYKRRSHVKKILRYVRRLLPEVAPRMPVPAVAGMEYG